MQSPYQYDKQQAPESIGGQSDCCVREIKAHVSLTKIRMNLKTYAFFRTYVRSCIHLAEVSQQPTDSHSFRKRPPGC